MDDINTEQFIYDILRLKAFQVGDFILKSGKKSNYFIDMGVFHESSELCGIGCLYAQLIYEKFARKDIVIDVIFGPSYKGIPIAIATAMDYKRFTNPHKIGYAFDRKETKDHGEGGLFVGSPLKLGTRVLVVDDVITSGITLSETIKKLPKGIILQGIVAAIDRQEGGVERLQKEFNVPVYTQVSIEEILTYVKLHD